MKNQYVLSVLIILFLKIGALYGYELEVKKLKCDFQTNPIAIDNKTPGLSWEIHSPDQRNIMQDSYQILVASSKELLNTKDADMWNSGNIKSDNSAQVIYRGSLLKSTTRYFWKIMIKDKNDVSSSFSEVSFFETGLFEQDDWKAKWIAAPSVWDWPDFLNNQNNEKKESAYPWENNAPLFRKEFQLL